MAEKKNTLNDEIIEGMEQLSLLFRSLLWEHAKEHRLSPMQVQILIHVNNNPDNVTISNLAIQFMLTKATISEAVKSLEYKGHILKRYSDTDKRSYSIELSDSGRRIAHIAGYYLEPVKKVISKITVADREILLKNIKGIIQKLNA